MGVGIDEFTAHRMAGDDTIDIHELVRLAEHQPATNVELNEETAVHGGRHE